MAIISGGWLSTIAMLSSGQNGIHIQCSSWIITLICNGSLLQGIFVSLYELNMVRFPCSRSIFKEDVIYTSVNFLYELGLYSSECVGRWDLIGWFLVYWLDLVSTLVYWTTGSGGLRCLASVNPKSTLLLLLLLWPCSSVKMAAEKMRLMLIIRLMAMLIAVGADMYHIAAAEMLLLFSVLAVLEWMEFEIL